MRYAITLEVVPDRTTFRGSARIEIALDRPRDTIFLHAQDLRAQRVRVLRSSAEVGSGTLEPIDPNGLVAVRLPAAMGPGKVTLEMSFDGVFNRRATGLYRVKSGDDWYAFTQFQPIDARRTFPCFDEPGFKTPFEITLRAPQGLTVISNTHIVSEKAASGGLREVRFAVTEQLPTYALAFAVGPFDVVDAPSLGPTALRTRTVPLRALAVKSRGAELATALREAPKILSALEQYLGVPYPYDKLDLIAVPNFWLDGMENAGAITFRDTLILSSKEASAMQRRRLLLVLAHELAHQWFGDYVTMASWGDLWLSEAFAAWMATRLVDELYPEMRAGLDALMVTQRLMDDESVFEKDPVHNPLSSGAKFGEYVHTVTYKGEAILTMFERALGHERLREGLRRYMQRHAFGTAAADDLLRALDEVGMKPELKAAWLTFLDQSGAPVLRADLDCASKPKAITLSQTRSLVLGIGVDATRKWHIPVCAKLGFVSGETREVCGLLRDEKLRLPLESETCPAWVMPNAKAAGYYRFALSPEGFAALVAARDKLSTGEQVSLAFNIWAAVRTGRLDVEHALAALLKLGLTGDRRVQQESIVPLWWTSEHLLDPATRPFYRAELRRLLIPVYNEVGLLPKANNQENDERKLLRAYLVSWLVSEARDPLVGDELARWGNAMLSMAGDPLPAELPVELTQLALDAAVWKGGAKLVDAALASFAKSEDRKERRRFLLAASAQRDPAQASRIMSLSLDTRLSADEWLLPIKTQYNTTETRAAAHAWLEANFDRLRSTLGDQAALDALAQAHVLCSEAEADQLERNFAPRVRDIPGGPHQLELTLVAVRTCAATFSTQAQRARDFFNALGAASAPPGWRVPPQAPSPLH